MQGISQSKHQHLVDALLQLEHLLSSSEFGQDGRILASAYREKLEIILLDYNRQVADLAELIDEYQELFHNAKVHFLSPKLKELRKNIKHDAKVFPLLAKNIQMVYGT